MAGAGSSGKDDWSHPVEPPRVAVWFADHRIVARVVLVVVDVVVLGLAITGLDSSGRHWTAFVVLVAWLGITVNFGWVMPKQVDAWRRRREGKT